MQDAETLTDEYEAACIAYADAARAHAALEDERKTHKLAAMTRMQGAPKSGGGAYSWTQAEQFVETDAEYLAYLKRVREADHEQNIQRGRMDTAKLRARLAIALLEAGHDAGSPAGVAK